MDFLFPIISIMSGGDTDDIHMAIDKNKLFLFIAGGSITLFFLLPIIFPSYRQLFLSTAHAYPYLLPFIIILFRFLGVVIAPLPGMPVAFASMVLLPWWQAGIYNFLGSAAGGICAFFIARQFRERAVAYFAPLQKIHEWQEKFSQKKQFAAFIFFRFASLSAFDFVVYAIGLTKIPFRMYLATVFLVDFPITALFFYLGGLSLKYGIYLFIIFAVMFALIFSFLFKHHTAATIIQDK